MDKKIKLTWAGNEKVISPTMELCNDIENIIDVSKFVLGTVNQSAKMGDCVKVIGATLRFAELPISDEEVYQEVCQYPLGDILNIVLEILRKVFPMFFQTPKKKNTSTSQAA